jgi:hypothetical protein
MKKIAGITILLSLLVVTAFSQDAESKRTSEFEIISIHDLKLKPGVNEKEFETFVVEKLAPIYDKMKGQKLILVKGDRGVRTNQYAIILTFESLEDRNRIYPPSGGFVGDFGDQSIWDKFESMVDVGLGERHTDYVKVAH